MRLQLALNVENLDESIDFYSKMFDTPPAKIKEGYANFEVAEPPLKLVLMQNPGLGGSLNHLGVEVESADQVEAAEARIAGEGLATTGVDDTLCCFAAKTETWVHGPDTAWEWYVKTADAEVGSKMTPEGREFESISVGGSECCGPAPDGSEGSGCG